MFLANKSPLTGEYKALQTPVLVGRRSCSLILHLIYFRMGAERTCFLDAPRLKEIRLAWVAFAVYVRNSSDPYKRSIEDDSAPRSIENSCRRLKLSAIHFRPRRSYGPSTTRGHQYTTATHVSERCLNPTNSDTSWHMRLRASLRIQSELRPPVIWRHRVK